MKISSLFFGFLVFFAIIGGVGNYYTETSANYNFTAPVISVYDNTSTLQVMVDNMAQPLKSGQLTFVDIPFVVLNTAWTAVTIPFQIIDIGVNMLGLAISENYGVPLLPDWFTAILTVMLVAVVVFTIIYIATKGAI